jgi:hypothetical protein
MSKDWQQQEPLQEQLHMPFHNQDQSTITITITTINTIPVVRIKMVTIITTGTDTVGDIITTMMDTDTIRGTDMKQDEGITGIRQTRSQHAILFVIG